MRNGETKQMLSSLEFSQKIKSYEIEKEKLREPLNNSKAKSAGREQIARRF